jgi:hypothetical protein
MAKPQSAGYRLSFVLFSTAKLRFWALGSAQPQSESFGSGRHIGRCSAQMGPVDITEFRSQIARWVTAPEVAAKGSRPSD